jgi:hypothetical protein
MRNRAVRTFATILSLLVAVSSTVQAGPISITQVIQVVGSQPSTAQIPDLRLRAALQNDGESGEGSRPVSTGTVSSGATTTRSASPVADGTLGAAPVNADSLLSGIALRTDDAPANIDVIAQGDIEGSICDCGEIPVVENHHVPLWPLLFLAAVPLFFIHHHDCNSCPTPTPTPNCKDCGPPPVPEPTTLLLFGSGLAAVGAGLRRRYARSKLERALAGAEEAN